ncbi:MAG: hypothetical protein JNJ46_31695 [Myxococcales bacterium]|nr:hypothetical protein [Myxococcales bacterium]
MTWPALRRSFRLRRARWLAPVLLAAASLPARATPQVGETLPDVTVEGSDGSRRLLPDRRIATIVIYEDSDAGTQNQRAAALIDAATDLAENKAKLEAVAVADLEKWNFWPARKFAVAEVKKVAAKEHATIYIDLKADVRRTWKLAKHKSGILIVGSDSRVRFAAEGPLSDAQLDELKRSLVALGAALPQQVVPDASYHEAPRTPPLPANAPRD